MSDTLQNHIAGFAVSFNGGGIHHEGGNWYCCTGWKSSESNVLTGFFVKISEANDAG